jgi:hypothetical protein
MVIAETINGLAIAPEARSHVTARFASMLANSLSHFDRSRFVAACDPYCALRAETEVEPDADVG